LEKEITMMPLLLDGGNFVNNGKYAFITDRILEDNGIFTQKEIERVIEVQTGLQPIIIERNKCDNIGHIDAYISFLDKNTVAIPNYPSFPFLADDIEFVTQLEEHLRRLGLKVIKLEERPIDEIGHCGCSGKKRTPCIYSARGNYINFLRINNLIILPEFTLPTKKESNYYNKVNGEILEEMGFEVKRINCDMLARFGGVLHCISYLA
jgi:agmatine/peptidylarginine deiminase